MCCGCNLTLSVGSRVSSSETVLSYSLLSSDHETHVHFNQGGHAGGYVYTLYNDGVLVLLEINLITRYGSTLV